MKKSFREKLETFYPLISPSELLSSAELFYREIVMALANQPSSLPCILNPLSRILPRPGFGVAVSIGGTNAYVSGFQIKKKKEVKFFRREFFSLPPRLTKEDLFSLLTKKILKTSARKKNLVVGISFAYPLKPILREGVLDGILLTMSKGREIKGLVGKKVGEEYERFLQKKYGIKPKVLVANDTVCLLLGGETEIAGVVGTGLNFAYWEKRLSISPLRLSEISDFSLAEVAVNLEAKNFDKIKGSLLRKMIDEKSSDRGFSLAEKEAAGAYLYQIFNLGREKMGEEGFPQLSSTDQLNELLISPQSFFSSAEKKIVRKAKIFAERIFHRSAQIVALELAGVLKKIKKTQGLVPIAIEGGVFWKARNYPALVNLYLHQILPLVTPSFARIFGSSRRGAAILASSLF